MGTLLTNNNKISEISSRVMVVNRVFYANLKLFKYNLLFRSTKIKIYDTNWTSGDKWLGIY